MNKNKICFVVSPIGSKDSPQRKRADKILKHIIRPVCNDMEYKAVRADEIDEPGLIIKSQWGQVYFVDIVPRM